MTNEEFWGKAFLSALNRLPADCASLEADGALQILEGVQAEMAPRQGRWVGNVLKGWPTPEDMKRTFWVNRPDLSWPFNSKEFWSEAFVSALGRLPLESAQREANAALKVWQERLASNDSPGGQWKGNILTGWPTPEDMRRSVRADGSDWTAGPITSEVKDETLLVIQR